MGRLVVLFAALALSCAVPSRAQEKAANPDPSSEIVTDLASFWLDGVREKVRQIKMEVYVNYYDPAWNLLWAEVNGDYGYLYCATKMPIRSGDKFLIEGTVIPEKGISADTAKITVLERDGSRKPLEVEGQLSDAARLKARLVTFEATFDREQTSDGNHLVFDLVAEGYRIHTFYWTPEPKFLGLSQGARVRVTGVYSGNQDPNTASLEIDVWCNRLEDIHVLGGPEDDPRFENPVVPIDALPNIFAARGKQAHVAGTVRGHTLGRNVVVRDETGEVIVQTLQTLPLQIGDWVEAIGAPLTGGTDWLLKQSIIRRAAPTVVADKKRAAAAAPPTLRLIDQVLALSPKESAAAHPVDIVGVTLWSHPEADFIYVGDTSGSVRVQLPSKLGDSYDKPGSQLRINGVTRLGAFAPEVALVKSSQIATTLFPEAKELTLEQAMTGLEEGRHVSLRGHVQRVTSDGVWSRLTLSTQTGTFEIVLGRDDSLNTVLGSIISVQGVCRAIPNSRRQLTRIEILVTRRDNIRIEQPALADPLAAPLREISALRQFNVNGPLSHWVRVQGIVTQHVPGRFTIIQDGSEGLILLSEQNDVLTPGDLIEATGLPGFENGRVALREVIYRKIDRGAQPVPVKITTADVITEELDSCLVKIRGTLVSTALDGENINLAIQADKLVFAALLPRISAKVASKEWQTGSELELTGVYGLVRDERRQPKGFHLQLRSPADVRILKDPSWWTPTRAFAVTGLLVGCIALGLTWVVALRHRVTTQKDQLRLQSSKKAKLDAHNRAIVANANDCIFTTDLVGNFTSFNPAGERLLGYSQNEILQLNLRALIAPEDITTSPELISSLTGKNHTAAKFELRLVAKNQQRIWTEINACLVQTEGELVGVLGVARDIGDRKQIEEELKRARDAAQANTEAKSAFLANMSHEIRTPMNGVIGMSNMILETHLSTEQREYAETIRNSAESLLTVLNDILDFSKIEAGKLHFEMLDFDLVTSVEECLELLTAQATSKHIELSLFIPPALPRLLKGDAGRLRQVLVNLLGNAIKFTSVGEVSVSVSAEQETASDLTLRFEVSDTGVGVASEEIGRLFHPFSQADASTTRRFGGTGLGLAISKQIVQMMKGTIGVTSRPGHGSTFWFTVKLEKQVIDLAASSNGDFGHLRELRMLTVGFNAAHQRTVAAYAPHWEMSNQAVPSSSAALIALRQAANKDDPYRIVVVEHQLPEMNGLLLAEALRAEQRFKDVAVVFITSIDQRISTADLQRLRLSAVVTKPLSPDELLLAIGRAVATVNPEDTAIETELNASTVDPQKHESTTRLLVAEDNVVNQRVILLQLKKLGYNADIAANGSEVIQALERAPYDTVLMDCQMPEMDGYETTRAIKNDQRFAHLRIIAMTANAMQGDRERCLAAGMDDYLSKPTRITELDAALTRCMNRETGSTPGSRPATAVAAS